jgi:hypothetical protein
MKRSVLPTILMLALLSIFYGGCASAKTPTPVPLPTQTGSNGGVTTAFADVSVTHWAYSWIERVYAAGITTGCSTSPLSFCPENPVSQAEMAVLIERGKNGAAYTPPAGTGTVFTDVPLSYWAVNWIEKLSADGITTGCGGGNYCPENLVTRGEMAMFLLKAKNGGTYSPPAAVGLIADVPAGDPYAAWIEQLYNEHITSGCSASPLMYCPTSPVTRAQMAKFLVLTFNLP